MAASLIDSRYFGDTFANPAMRLVFSDEARFRSWLDAEAALARTQARLGLIPVSAAEEISPEATIERLDPAAMKAEYERVGFPILPLVHQLAKACDPESARWVHWGEGGAGAICLRLHRSTGRHTVTLMAFCVRPTTVTIQ